MSGSESLSTRLAKPEKCEFTSVNDHFEGKHNAVIGLYGLTSIYGLYFPFAHADNACRQFLCFRVAMRHHHESCF